MVAFNKLFGIDFRRDEMKVDKLPIYLTARRTFHKLSYSDIAFILIDVSEAEKFGAVALEKQMKLISEKYGMPVAFHFQFMTKQQRNILVNKNIPFISESEQLYLPFLGMSLHNRFIQPKEINTKKMMPVTQMLFLYLLYYSDGNPILKKDAAEVIGVTRTSITRASDQLAAMGLISQEMHGKECRMISSDKGMKLFKMGRPYLINPIQQTIITVFDDQYNKLPLSGESALAKQTTLNSPSIPIRAIHKTEIDPRTISSIDTRWSNEDNVVKLELWKYDPSYFAKNEIVDPVSLAMSLEDNVDERVEGAIEEYLEEYQW